MFWKYLRSLEGKDQDVTIVDDSACKPPEDPGKHLAAYLTEIFVPEKLPTPQQHWLAQKQPDSNEEGDIGRVMVVRALAHLEGSTSKRLAGIPASVRKSLGKNAVMIHVQSDPLGIRACD